VIGWGFQHQKNKKKIKDALKDFQKCRDVKKLAHNNLVQKVELIKKCNPVLNGENKTI